MSRWGTRTGCLGHTILPQANLDSARTHFGAFQARSKKAGTESGQLLAEGYLLVVDLIQKPADEQANKRFSEVKAALAPLEDGEFFGEQLDTALGVFQGGK